MVNIGCEKKTEKKESCGEQGLKHCVVMAVREQAKALFVCAIIGPLCCVYWQSAWPMVVMWHDVIMEVCFWR